jgi:predicted nucleic acid-binding Zn ribbon protein
VSNDPEDESTTWVHDDDDVLRPARAPTPVGELLGQVVTRRRWGQRLETAAVFSLWDRLVGEETARRCEPVRVEGRTLVIRAESSTWATEITYLVDRILDKSEDVIGAGVIDDIRVVVGPLEGTVRQAKRAD